LRRFNRAALTAACAGLVLAAASVAVAQDTEQHQVIRIWSGDAPGTTWSGAELPIPIPVMGTKETRTGITNVTTPTITVFRPPEGKANGNAMIVCPGGGFMILAWDIEGTEIARWLTERGITAFVLKYRVHMDKNFALPTAKHSATSDKAAAAMESDRELAVADGIQAVHYIRANAAYFGISPDHIGIMGFSAGAMTSLGVAMDSGPADRPNLVASIYGMMENKPLPKDAPPIFISAAANDDTIPIQRSLDIFSAWHNAEIPAELHVYEKGGHGFAMVPHHTTSDDWTVDFETWLRAHGWITDLENSH
jgi:acetyl esterase/lipase